MSRTTVVTFASRGFWAWDDAFGVWLAYLVEQIEAPPPDEFWQATVANDWRTAAAITDFGARIPQATADQLGDLETLALEARQRAVDAGDVPVERLRTWLMVDDVPVAQGFSRTGDAVELRWILEVADGFIALLDGTLRPDPPREAWLLGTGRGYLVAPYREDFPEDAPRFHGPQ